MVAFKRPSVILGLYKCNYSFTRGKELGAAARWTQGAGPDRTRWRAGFGPPALGLPPTHALFDGREKPCTVASYL